MNYSSLNSKIEQALQAYLLAITPALPCQNIVCGKDADYKTLPEIICAVPDGAVPEEDPPYSGNFWQQVQVIHRGQKLDATKAANDASVAATFDALAANNLPALLSAKLADFTCFGVTYGGPESAVVGSSWEDTLHLRLYCCASAIPA